MSNKIGRFEIINEIARSEIGCTYKASDTETGQTVALKTIDLQLLGDQAETLVQRIVEEAETSKALNSQNIAVLYGAGDIDGKLCAAMDYVQGNSIATMLARKEGFSIWDLLDIGRQLTSGLDHATSLKLVHYSLEPSKIMCGWDGTVKILSFGVSSVGQFAQHVSQGLPSFLHYMSPEQAAGEDLDARTDLFSFGAVLYEMATARPAFSGNTSAMVFDAILHKAPVSPVRLNSDVPPELERIIGKALEKDRKLRYQTASEMVADLKRLRRAIDSGQPLPVECRNARRSP